MGEGPYGRGKAARAKSSRAREVISQVIVAEGLSYEEAARRCDERAAAASAPYREAAAVIRQWLDDIPPDRDDS